MPAYSVLLRVEIARFTRTQAARLCCSDPHLTVERCYLLRDPVQSGLSSSAAFRLMHQRRSGGLHAWIIPLQLREPHPASLPLEIELAMRCRAISQIQIDQALIRDAYVQRNRLEIVDAFLVQANGDLLLELRSVWVLDCFRKIVFGTHGVHLSYDFASVRVAFLAEIKRIT